MDPLNLGTSLSTPIGENDMESSQILEDVFPGSFNLENFVLDKIEFDVFNSELKKDLTGLENRCHDCYRDGLSYREIASDLKETEKTVDNALVRVRKKAKRVIEKHISINNDEFSSEFSKQWKYGEEEIEEEEE